jgi:hypothetical protein
MYVLYIDIVIMSVDLATVHYFFDCYPSAMTVEVHTDYSHRQMSLVAPWPTTPMLLLVVFVRLASSMCSYVLPIWCLYDADQNMQKSKRFLVPWANMFHQSMPFMTSLLKETYTLEVLIYLTSDAMTSQVDVMSYTLFQPLIFKSNEYF